MTSHRHHMRQRLAIPRWVQETRDPTLPLQDAVIFGVPASDLSTSPEKHAQPRPQEHALIWMDAMSLAPTSDLTTLFSQASILLWVDTTSWPHRPPLGRVKVTQDNGILIWNDSHEETQGRSFLLNVGVEQPEPAQVTVVFPLRERASLLALIATIGSCSLILDAPWSWRQLARTMKPPQLLEAIQQHSRDVLELMMGQTMTSELLEHLKHGQLV